MGKKKIILIIVCIIILGIAILLAIKLNKNKNDLQNSVENTIQNTVKNTVGNNVIKNEVANTAINIVEKNKTEKNNNIKIDEIIADPEQEIDRDTIQKQQSNEEMAIDIAKKEWGPDNNVEFTFDHIDEDGKYVIFVRDIETTRQIDAFTIDIQTGNIVQ